jgi:glycosyltransferase involved in cell wall biosynthesis
MRISKEHGNRANSSIVSPLHPSDIAELVAATKRDQPEFILIEGVHLLQAAEAISAAMPSVPLICDMHNIESALNVDLRKQRVAKGLKPFASLYARRRLSDNRLAERQMVNIARQIWVCSLRDQAVAENQLGALKTAVIANPIPNLTSPEKPRPKKSCPQLLFVGHLGYLPNRHAIKFLCKKMMPRLQRQIPDARLQICGRLPRSKTVKLIAKHGHELISNPLDLSAAYNRATAAVIPLFEGGGTRLKVLEAMAAGCPVVATQKAVEGLNLCAPHHYRNAETAEEFVEQIAALHQDLEAVDEMISNAQRFVGGRFGTAARCDSIRSAIAKLFTN